MFSETDDTFNGALQKTITNKVSDVKPTTLSNTVTPRRNINTPTSKATPMSTINTECSSQPLDIFEGLKFAISGFTDEKYDQLKEIIESMAGSTVSKTYKGIPDYAVVPVFGSSFYLTATEIVNDLWIAECKYEGEIREVMYYHRPIPVQSFQPLEGCVVTISSYIRYERNFLTHLIQHLGGTYQEQFARKSCPEKNILASTHLISLEANGKKYAAAIKWNLPVVNKDWLLDCARTGNLEHEKNYLVGEAKGEQKKSFIPILQSFIVKVVLKLQFILMFCST